jgi:hypothetical protein
MRRTTIAARSTLRHAKGLFRDAANAFRDTPTEEMWICVQQAARYVMESAAALRAETWLDMPEPGG